MIYYAVNRIVQIACTRDSEFPPASFINKSVISVGNVRPSALSSAEFETRVLQKVRSSGYRLWPDEDDSGRLIWGGKNLWGVWSLPLVHLGLVLVFLGGLLTFLFSDFRDITIGEGEVVDLPGTASRIKLEKFSIVLHPVKKRPEEYVSRLLIQTRKGVTSHHDLKVNHPLKLQGTKLFQMRYQVEILGLEIVVYREGKPVEALELKPGERKRLSQLPMAIEAKEVIPDFVIDPKGNVTSRSPYFRNPAVSILVYETFEAPIPKMKAWAFTDLFSHQGRKTGEFQFAIRRLKKRYLAGIKLSRDPGVPLVYGGFLFLVLGAFISSFVTPRAVKVNLADLPAGRQAVIEIFSPETGADKVLEKRLKVDLWSLAS